MITLFYLFFNYNLKYERMISPFEEPNPESLVRWAVSSLVLIPSSPLAKYLVSTIHVYSDHVIWIKMAGYGIYFLKTVSTI